MAETTNSTDLSQEITYLAQIRQALGNITITAKDSPTMAGVLQALDALSGVLDDKNNAIKSKIAQLTVSTAKNTSAPVVNGPHTR